MRGAHGYTLITGPDGTHESDSIRCNHCQRIELIAPNMQRPPEWAHCYGCSAAICVPCYEQLHATGCAPWEKRLELMERREAFLRGVERSGA